MTWNVQFAVRRDDLIYAAILVADDQPEIGSVLVCDESGARYRLLSIAMTGTDSWARGQRSLQLEPLNGVEEKPLDSGMHLSLVAGV